MKTIHLIVILALFLVSKAACDTAEVEYLKALKNARKQYVSRVVGVLSKFDRVEILQTDGRAKLFPPDDGSETVRNLRQSRRLQICEPPKDGFVILRSLGLSAVLSGQDDCPRPPVPGCIVESPRYLYQLNPRNILAPIDSDPRSFVRAS